jgi:hypothetical protein
LYLLLASSAFQPMQHFVPYIDAWPRFVLAQQCDGIRN